ncbi:serine hydrolase [uncultured Tateyamaria sp.]|uniref:serine hydrolase domain-containing protein n=1 Tax=uncultured Tateyamaria sp. TaxID=455651 RepID=UPI00263A0621|nr:serine hydrolase [uncultured Tateyamaria sp.]
MRSFLTRCIFLVWTFPAFAQGGQAQMNAAELVIAYDRWLVAQSTTGALGMGMRLEDGRWVTVQSADANAPGFGELASVSKSITAACALQLVEAGRLDWSDRLPMHLGTAPDVTVSELITHTSGLGPDSTQATMPFWLDRATDPSLHFSDHVLSAVNARDTQSGTRGTYLYNNENYALLGLVIEAASGHPFWETCRDVLDLNDDISPSPRTGGFQPWGGLQAKPRGYVRFLEAQYGPDSIIGDDPFALPHVALGDGAFYGLGIVFRAFGNGYNFWHFGALCISDRLNIGSYGVIWEGQAAALAVYEGCHDWDAMAALDGAMARAVYWGGK